MLRWNARINLTAVRDPNEIVTRHFGESLFLACHVFPLEQRAPSPAPEGGPIRVLDIGSGAGFPGLPLKLWAPTISLTLVESNHKKAAFLREVIRSLTLTNVNVLTVRAETLPGPVRPDTAAAHENAGTPASIPREAHVVTLRAVERFDAILPTAARLVAPAGRLAILIGSAQAEVLPALAPELRWAMPISVPESQSRVLSIGVRC